MRASPGLTKRNLVTGTPNLRFMRPCARMKENKDVPVTEVKNSLTTTASKEVTGTFADPLPKPLPSNTESTSDPLKSCADNETDNLEHLIIQYKETCPSLFRDVPSFPKQEPKRDPELEQKASEFFKSLKDKLQFFKGPEEHLVTREPSNVILYLQYDNTLSEDEARSILENWIQKGFVEIVQNQVILKTHVQEGL